VLLAVVYQKHNPTAAAPRALFSFTVPALKKYVQVTWPVILNETIWSLGVSLENMVYARKSTQVMASFNITDTISHLVWVFLMGFGCATAAVIGKRIGERDDAGARRAAVQCSRFMVLCACAAALLLIPLAQALPLLFKVEAEVIVQARRMLYGAALCYPLWAFNRCVLAGVERAGGDTVYCALSDLLSQWCVGLPLGALLAFVFHAPAAVIFLGFAAEDVCKAAASFVRLRSGKWLHHVT